MVNVCFMHAWFIRIVLFFFFFILCNIFGWIRIVNSNTNFHEIFVLQTIASYSNVYGKKNEYMRSSIIYIRRHVHHIRFKCVLYCMRRFITHTCWIIIICDNSRSSYATETKWENPKCRYTILLLSMSMFMCGVVWYVRCVCMRCACATAYVIVFKNASVTWHHATEKSCEYRTNFNVRDYILLMLLLSFLFVFYAFLSFLLKLFRLHHSFAAFFWKVNGNDHSGNECIIPLWTRN